MPDIAETIKDAVRQALHERVEPTPVCSQHGGLMVALDAIKADTAKIPQIAARLGEHLGEHKGHERASGAHVAQGQAKVARWSALGTWARVVLVAVGMVAAAAAFVAFGSQALRAEQPTGIELRTEIKAAVRGEIKAAVADAFADMRDDEP